MLTTDAGKALQAAPGAGKRLNVTRLILNVTTAAAVVFDIESVGGATELFKAPASLAAGNYIIIDSEGPGISLPENVGLSVVAAAGVGATVFAEGDIEHLALT
jgi:hypothetical protein